MAKQHSGNTIYDKIGKNIDKLRTDYFKECLTNLTNAAQQLVVDETKLDNLRDTIPSEEEGLAHFMAVSLYETAKFKFDSDKAALMDLRRQFAAAEEYIATAART